MAQPIENTPLISSEYIITTGGDSLNFIFAGCMCAVRGSERSNGVKCLKFQRCLREKETLRQRKHGRPKRGQSPIQEAGFVIASKLVITKKHQVFTACGFHCVGDLLQV